MILIELGRDAPRHLVGAPVRVAPVIVMPLLEIRVRAGHPAPHRGVVDRLLEPLRKLHLCGAAAVTGGPTFITTRSIRDPEASLMRLAIAIPAITVAQMSETSTILR